MGVTMRGTGWISGAALLLCLAAASFAGAAEGMGAHRGSLVFFPYWTVRSPFLTIWRICNAVDLDDPIMAPVVSTEDDPAYDTNPLHLHVTFRRSPDCGSAAVSLAFSHQDYRLIVVNQIHGISGSGYAWGRAVIIGDGQPGGPAVWDRFVSDTILVNTAEGWARGWNNYQQMLGDAKGLAGRPLVAPSNFFAHYLTREFRFGGSRAADTEFSITPLEVREPSAYEPGENARFTSGGTPDFDYDAVAYDPDEGAFSLPARRVVCQEVLTIQELTSGHVRGIPQGWVHFWALDPPGDPDPNGDGVPFDPAGGDDWDAAAVLSWDRIPTSGSDLAWGDWTTHDRTTVDDGDIINGVLFDFDPEN